MTGRGRRAVAALLVVGMLGSVMVAGLASLFASQEPDGLQRVAQEQGFASSEEPSATSDGLFAGYGVDGVQNEGLSTSISAAAGLGMTFALGMGLFWFLSRKKRGDSRTGGPVSGSGMVFGSTVGADAGGLGSRGSETDGVEPDVSSYDPQVPEHPAPVREPTGWPRLGDLAFEPEPGDDPWPDRG